MQRWLTYLLIIFGLLPFQISPKFFSFYRAPWLKGWAGHTSSTVESELLLVIEYTTYMIVTCTQSPLMSLLESWNWCFFLSPWILKIFEEDIWFRLPNRRVASFILSFLSVVQYYQFIHCKENPIYSTYIFLFWELRGLSPNFHILVFVSNLHIYS